jgi:deoxycytidylate deaminase
MMENPRGTLKTACDLDLHHNVAVQEKFMRLALSEARKALVSGEVPVGCILVTKNGTVLATGHNLCNEQRWHLSYSINLYFSPQI